MSSLSDSKVKRHKFTCAFGKYGIYSDLTYDQVRLIELLMIKFTKENKTIKALEGK